ncbi:MAG: hypothetical protein GF317_04735 [Candidatus Lokiarchaeota archaeon]|nr:hypothetical protein [Candidatus Lokiarchaeota archaeon]
MAPAKCMDYGGSLNVLLSLQDVCDSDVRAYEDVKNGDYRDYKLAITIGYPLQRTSNTETAHIWCSPIGQLELAGEDKILYDLLTVDLRHRRRVGYLLSTSKGLTKALRKAWGNNIFYLPPFLTDREYLSIDYAERSGIACIGMNRNNKNYLNQYVAASLFSGDLLHIIDNSGGRGMFSANKFSELFNGKFVLHNAKKQEAYYNFLKKRRIGLQVSYSESFCYFVYELARMGIPSVVSGAVWWYWQKNKNIEKYCLVKNIDDIEEIAGKINVLLGNVDIYKTVCRESKWQAEAYGRGNKKEAQELINNILRRDI